MKNCSLAPMRMRLQVRASRLFLAGMSGILCCAPMMAQSSVRSLKVLGAKDAVEIEIVASDRIVPQTRILSRPDRLVVDFPNSVPGDQLHSQSIDRGAVKDVRVALFQSKPPVTRIVFDLKSAQSYQIFPDGRTVLIKVMGGGTSNSVEAENSSAVPATRAGILAANDNVEAEAVSEPKLPQPILEVSFQDGLLGIKAEKVTLAQVLNAVQQRTGAEVSIAAGAEREQVAANIAPAPPADVLARLLNGSRFNFLILSASNDPRKLDRVILSTRAEGGVMPLPQMELPPSEPVAAQPPPIPVPAPEPGSEAESTQPHRGAAPRVMVPPAAPPDVAPPDNNPQNQ